VLPRRPDFGLRSNAALPCFCSRHRDVFSKKDMARKLQNVILWANNVILAISGLADMAADVSPLIPPKADFEPLEQFNL
jgi:hypothetical protein